MSETPRLVTPLRARGFAVLPTPRQVELDGGETIVSAVKLQLAGVDAKDIAAWTLESAVAELHLPIGQTPAMTVRLSVAPGTVQTRTGDPRDEQAYRLQIKRELVEITGNGRPGLLYGVATLVQLLQSQNRRPLALPTGTIIDWPQFEMRICHWDTKHHQDRPETLRRFLDQMVAYKLNAVCFELEDKFEYPSHPVIGAPGAFTTAQLQELVRYGLERNIQIIPNVQAPAHLCYVLKHPEFAHLRCDESNYQICMDEPEAVKLKIGRASCRERVFVHV
jgi:hexosaminidase